MNNATRTAQTLSGRESLSNPTFKHLRTGIIYACRKDAVVMMGTQRYRKALKADEFVFNYVCQHGEQPIKVTY